MLKKKQETNGAVVRQIPLWTASTILEKDNIVVEKFWKKKEYITDAFKYQ
jgi:hypothetical protein